MRRCSMRAEVTMADVRRVILVAALAVSLRAEADDRRDDRCGHDRGKRCKPYILATGRRDPRMLRSISSVRLRPATRNTPNAIVSRSKPALDRLDSRPLGDSANLAISEDGRNAYVVNHPGATDNAE